jgi:hypothetical protein
VWSTPRARAIIGGRPCPPRPHRATRRPLQDHLLTRRGRGGAGRRRGHAEHAERRQAHAEQPSVPRRRRDRFGNRTNDLLGGSQAPAPRLPAACLWSAGNYTVMPVTGNGRSGSFPEPAMRWLSSGDVHAQRHREPRRGGMGVGVGARRVSTFFVSARPGAAAAATHPCQCHAVKVGSINAQWTSDRSLRYARRELTR